MGSPTPAQVPAGGSQPPACAAARLIELVAAEQVDEAVVGEPRDEDLRDVPQRRVQLQRPGQPLADPLEQPHPVRLPLRVPAAGLGDQHHHAVDVARRAAQRHRELPEEHQRAVAAAARQRVLPRHPAQHLAGELVGLAGPVVRDEPEGVQWLARQLRGLATAAAAVGRRVRWRTVRCRPVRDDDADLGLAQHELSRQILAGAPSFQRVIATLRSLNRSPGYSLDTKTCEATSARGRQTPSGSALVSRRGPGLRLQPPRATPRVRVVSRLASV